MDGVMLDVDGKTYRLRLTMRAMMAVEERLGDGFFAVVQRLEDPDKMRVSDLTHILAAMMADGRGADVVDACDLFDALGFEAVMAAFGEAITKGMPAAAEGAGKKTKAPNR